MIVSSLFDDDISTFRVSQNKRISKIFNSDLIITLIQSLLFFKILLDSMDQYILFDMLFVILACLNEI